MHGNKSDIIFSKPGADFHAEFYKLDSRVKKSVEQWFSGECKAIQTEGERSVFIHHPIKDDTWLKIKGAGVKGKFIDFDQKHATGPKWPRFDFDGRRMEDVALGHVNAFEGGASFQQAQIEWAVSRHLASAGYDIVHCPGFGRLTYRTVDSWFTVFEIPNDLIRRNSFPAITAGSYFDLMYKCGQTLVQIAQNENLIGNCWFYSRPDGSYIIKDLHPFTKADTITMSALSWVMQLAFALHIPTVLARMKGTTAPLRDPAEFAIPLFKVVCPDVTTMDYDNFRFQIVKPYMIDPAPENFSPEKLLRILKGNVITASLLEQCPKEFARP